MKTALFFGTHPDDLEIGCGGTIALLVNNRKNCILADLTRGELSTRGTVEERKAEADDAGKKLGVKKRYNLDIADGNIENNEANRFKVIDAIRNFKPDIIFAPFQNDRHPDHGNASKLITDCFFYSGVEKIVTAHNAHRAKNIFYYQQTDDIPVSFITDITGTFESKMKSIRAYKSQFFNPERKTKEKETLISSEAYIKNIETRAKGYGFKIGAEYGEAFYSGKALKADPEILFKI